jgi:hypothetical protein
VKVQNVPLGMRRPGSAGAPGVPFWGEGVGDATAREMRARMRVEVRMFAFDVEFGGWVGM